MDLLTLVRAAHLGAVILVFGEFAFLRFVWPARQAHPGFIPTAAWSLLAAILSGAVWLALEAQSMSGLPIKQALQTETLSVVLLQTLFGRVWVARLALAVLLATTLWGVTQASGRFRPALFGAGGLLALLLLASIAFAGHAAAGTPGDRAVRLGSDMVHLLGAGAWLGALVPLIVVFYQTSRDGRVQALRLASQATRRFSGLGVAAMAALVVSGLINASFTVADWKMFVESEYGRLLGAKLVIFLLILGLAGINRLVLTPSLVARPNSAARLQSLRRLWLTSMVELMLGIAIIVIVGRLGITVPAAHVHPH